MREVPDCPLYGSREGPSECELSSDGLCMSFEQCVQKCALTLCPLMGSSGCPICAVLTEKYFVVCSMSGFKVRLFELLCVVDKFRC